jgi:Kdo2-lipid IVA lauroyltransferase/acyltransferase
MQAIFFYSLFPFIYLLALLPHRIVYLLSDGMYYILKWSGYRKAVILKNLCRSFPEKSDQEIAVICNDYYRYLCDLILETLRTIRMSEEETRKRCTFHQAEWLTQLHKEGRSIMIVMGHYGNWEWAGPIFTLDTKYQLVVIYRPLSNKYFEKMMVGMRTRFGTKITPVDKTLRDMVANRNQITATAFIADQAATAKNAYWTTFLNQDTAVFTGPDKLAKKFNYPVVYIKVARVKRGHYEVTPELLFLNPKDTDDNEVLEKFTNKLETDIIRDPVTWLWSHKRWKHKRPQTSELQTEEIVTNSMN